MDLKNIPLAPMPRVLIDLKGGDGEMSLFPEDQISEDVWENLAMNVLENRRFLLIDTVDQNVGEYVLNGHGRFKITREQQPFDGVCAPVVYHAEEMKTALPFVMFWFPDTGDVVEKATKEYHEDRGGWIADLIELGYELIKLHWVSTDDQGVGTYASDNGAQVKIRRNYQNATGYEIAGF